MSRDPRRGASGVGPAPGVPREGAGPPHSRLGCHAAGGGGSGSEPRTRFTEEGFLEVVQGKWGPGPRVFPPEFPLSEVATKRSGHTLSRSFCPSLRGKSLVYCTVGRGGSGRCVFTVAFSPPLDASGKARRRGNGFSGSLRPGGLSAGELASRDERFDDVLVWGQSVLSPWVSSFALKVRFSSLPDGAEGKRRAFWETFLFFGWRVEATSGTMLPPASSLN